MKFAYPACVASAVLAACVASPASVVAAANAPLVVSQTSTASPLPRLQNDARMLKCDRWQVAYGRLKHSHTDVANSLRDFAPSDAEYEKLSAVVTQLNDAMMLIKDRGARDCPGFRV